MEFFNFILSEINCLFSFYNQIKIFLNLQDKIRFDFKINLKLFKPILIRKKKKFLTGPSGVSLILLLNSFPSITMKSSPDFKIPHLRAIDLAVFILSPVTMRTVIPDL